jgi:hypothetical protein
MKFGMIGAGTVSHGMSYVGSPVEQPSLGQGLPMIQVQDRWSCSLDGWEGDIADVVAHPRTASATIAGHMAEPSDR